MRFPEKLLHFITGTLVLRIRGKSYIGDKNRELKLTVGLRTEITGMAKKQKIVIGKSPSVAEPSR